MSLFLFTCIDVLVNCFELSVKDMNLLNALRVFEMCKVRFWFFLIFSLVFCGFFLWMFIRIIIPLVPSNPNMWLQTRASNECSIGWMYWFMFFCSWMVFMCDICPGIKWLLSDIVKTWTKKTLFFWSQLTLLNILYMLITWYVLSWVNICFTCIDEYLLSCVGRRSDFYQTSVGSGFGLSNPTLHWIKYNLIYWEIIEKIPFISVNK